MPKAKTTRDIRENILDQISNLREIESLLPGEARARAIAITKLQEAAMWLNAAIMGEPR